MRLYFCGVMDADARVAPAAGLRGHGRDEEAAAPLNPPDERHRVDLSTRKHWHNDSTALACHTALYCNQMLALDLENGIHVHVWDNSI